MSVALPPEVAHLVGSERLHGHGVLLATTTDVDDGGRAAEIWLLVTERELATIDLNDTKGGRRGRILRSIPLASITGYRVQSEVGCGYLQAQQNGVWFDILRFTNRLSPHFLETAQKLERLRVRNEIVVEPSAEIGSAPQCAGCGAPLAPSGAACRACAAGVGVWKRLLPMLRPHAGKAALIGGLSLVAVSVECLPPMLQKYLVDNVLGKGARSADLSGALLVLAGIVVSLAVARAIAVGLAVWKAKLSSEVGTRLTADLRTQMVDKLQRLSVSYHDQHQVGVLMSRVSYDTEAMHTLMHQISGGFLLQVLQLVGIGVMLFVLNPKLAFFTLLPMPLVAMANSFFLKHLHPRYNRYWEAVARQAGALSSMLSGIRVVKTFTQEAREKERFRDSSERLRESRVSVDLVTSSFSSLIGFLFGLGGLVVWYVGGNDVLTRQMSLGSLMAFLAYLAMFYAPLTTITESITWFSGFLTASQRIFELLDTPVRVDEPAHPHAMADFAGEIRFENVRFSYGDNKPGLEDINFRVRPGQSVGIVGPSGSGKTTMACLISRLYDVSGGSVTLDGIDVRKISSRELRRRVGMVLQDSFLFEGTIAANIVYGNPDALPDKIIAAAKAASAHEFIMRQPFGYESMLGERGSGLSGGERQRLSIARAILYEPQILILDEATSSIDTESERMIQEAVDRFSKGRTTLTIAHRLSTLRNADLLLVLDRGRIVEQGTHQQLLANRGLYARLVRMQHGKEAAQQAAARLEHAAEAGAESPETETAAASAGGHASEGQPGPHDPAAPSPWLTRWLDPAEMRITAGEHGVLTVEIEGRTLYGVSATRAFPATHSDEYLSVRHVDSHNRDYEIGMIRSLTEWPAEAQELIRRSLNRRHLLRLLTGVSSMRLHKGALSCIAETDAGEIAFTLSTGPESIKKFGPRGRLLIDVDGNHYLITDLNLLSAARRRQFQMQFADF